MPNTLRTAGLAVLAAGVTEALRSGHASTSMVADWPAQASLALTGQLDQILRWARCPAIRNGSFSVRWMLQPVRDGSAVAG